MPSIFLSCGEKGGVGKSLFCKTLAQYFIDQEVPFSLCETDRSNPDVMRSYKSACKTKLGVFSESPDHEDSANSIYNDAIKHHVLVNLPAQCFIPLRNWFINNELFTIAAEDGVKFKFLHVSDGGFDSLQLFKKTLETFGLQASYVFVKNLGRSDDWGALEEDQDLLDLMAQNQVRVMVFPKLIGAVDRNRIDQLSLTFGKAREYKSFSSITKQRIRKFLRDAYGAFEQAEVLT